MNERIEADAAGAQLVVTTDVAARDWDDFVESRPSSTGYHQWCWRGLFERVFHHETVYLTALRGSDVAGVLPLVAFRGPLFGRCLVSLPFVNYGGVLANDTEAASLLVRAAGEEADRRGAAHVELRHTRRLFPDLPVRRHKVAMTMRLAGSEEAAWQALNHKVRNQIRKAHWSGLHAEVGGVELAGDFYRVFAANMRDLGSPVYPRRLFTDVLTSIPDSHAYVVRQKGKPVAAGITIGYRDVVENPWASSLRKYRALCPNMLLYWMMIRDAIARGYERFDFGRSTPHEGTYRFKKQWGAEESPFYWEYVLAGGRALPKRSPRNPKFQVAVAVWRRLPLWTTRLLGPAIVRNIP